MEAIVIRRSLLWVGLFSFLVTPLSGQEPTLVIENGRVIVGNGTVLERGSVVVRENRILAVTDQPVEAHDARRINAFGKTVLPGLIDANVHLLMSAPTPDGQPENDEALSSWVRAELPNRLRAYLKSGVTSVMSTGDYWPFILSVRDRIATGSLPGPRLVAVGPTIGAPGGHPDSFVCGDNEFCKAHLSVAVASRPDARQAVTRLAESGVDAIKLVWDDMGGRLPTLSRELVQIVINEAHARNLPVYVHVVDAGLAAETLEWGADRLVHVPAPASNEAADTFIKAMQARRASAATTLATLDWLVRQNDDPPALVRLQKAVHDFTERLAAYDDSLVAFGTDAPWLTPSESIHREIRLLEEAGLSPMQILRAATQSAAAHIGRSQDLGTLEPGKLADLIVVDGDPSEDLSALWDVEVVVKGGEVVVHHLEIPGN